MTTSRRRKTRSKAVAGPLLLWLLTAAWMILIFCFSAQNGEGSSALSGGIVQWLIGIFIPGFPEMDAGAQAALADVLGRVVRKAAHAGEYAVLGVLTSLAVRAHRAAGRRAVVIPAAICLLYAAGDEFHQWFVPGRTAAAGDVFIDFAGALAGIGLTMLILLVRRRRIAGKRGRYSASMQNTDTARR